jgi:PAS domain S-box-containing protein
MRLAGARVLLVEDNSDMAANVREILEFEGAAVAHATTAAQAIELSRDQFDVALSDVRLPDANGLSLLPVFRSAGDGLAEVLLVTGNATIDDAITAVDGGAYAYIVKPFKPEELIASMERAVRQVRSSRAARSLADKIQRRENNLRTLVDTVQALLLVLDDQGRVVQANPAVAKVAGVTQDELVGVHWMTEFVPEADRADVESIFARLVAGESAVVHENRVLSRNHNGSPAERFISWRSSPARSDSGSLLIYASGLDVTELRDLERRTALAHRLAAVGTLAAGLAHEIRNPLNSARLQLHLLDRRARKLGDATLAEPITLVNEEIARLSELVTEFLDFARPTVLAVEVADLSDIARRVVELEAPAASEHGIELSLLAPAPVELSMDSAKVTQVVLNLVRNAVEAIDESGEVTVAVRPDGAGGVLIIRDTGRGISDNVIGRIFEPFFSTKANGTGLGMAIVHSLITQHGGAVSVQNIPEGGAEFRVELPRKPPGASMGAITYRPETS